MEKAQPVITPVNLIPGNVLPLWGGLLLFAVWAALFGFGGIAAGAAGIAKICSLRSSSSRS